jgi:hypothetical protein
MLKFFSNIKFRKLVAFSLLLTPIFATSAPSIDSVVMSPTEPATLIIEGTGFGAKSQARPLYWFDFDHISSDSRNLNYGEKTIGIQDTGSITSDLRFGNSGRSLKFNISKTGGTAFEMMEFDSKNLYLYVQRYYDFDISDPKTWGEIGLNLKTNRFWSGFGGEYGNNIYLGYQGKEGVESGRITPELTGIKSVWPGKGLPHIANQWVQDEIILKSSDIGVENGTFDFIRNGSLSYDKKFIMRSYEKPNRYKMIFFDQISNGTSGVPLNIYYDDLYIDDTLQRVFLSDRESLSSAKNRFIQIPVEWEDNRIKAELNISNTSLAELYIYVADENGIINQSGFKVCGTCPGRPTQISID